MSISDYTPHDRANRILDLWTIARYEKRRVGRHNAVTKAAVHQIVEDWTALQSVALMGRMEHEVYAGVVEAMGV